MFQASNAMKASDSNNDREPDQTLVSYMQREFIVPI